LVALRYPRTYYSVLKGYDSHLNSGNTFGSANQHKEQEMSLVGLGWKTSVKIIHTASKIIPLRLFVMEIMRELLAVFMLTKDPENELFYRGQENAARVRRCKGEIKTYRLGLCPPIPWAESIAHCAM
jgi:hypothetical protein